MPHAVVIEASDGLEAVCIAAELNPDWFFSILAFPTYERV
jgi:hypothetical protein